MRKGPSRSCVSISRYPGLEQNCERLQSELPRLSGLSSPPELQALKHFKQQGCNVVPEILGYQFEKQDMEDIIPGGFVTYVIWKKVPGEPLDFTRFWNCTFSERDIIRDKFRQIYEYVAYAIR